MKLFMNRKGFNIKEKSNLKSLGIFFTVLQAALLKWSRASHEYTVKNVSDFLVPSRDVTNQTVPLAGNKSIIPRQGEFGK